MTLEDAKKAIDGFREEGHTEEDIARTFYLMFVDGVLNLEDFETLIGLVGYELTEEFKSMSPEEQKTKPFEDMEEPSEEKEESQPQPQPKEKEESQPSEEEKEDPQPQDEEKALKLFGLNK